MEIYLVQLLKAVETTKVKYQIPAYKNVNDLTGYGIEYLLDLRGNVIAKFDNGNMVTSQAEVKVSAEDAAKITLIAA